MKAARALLVVMASCGADAANHPPKNRLVDVAAPKSMRIVREDGRAAMAIVSREGDPNPAIGAFVSTHGIGRSALVPVAIAALVEARAAVRATPQADGVRISIEAPTANDASSAIARVAAALAEPVTSATDLSVVQRKAHALTAFPRTLGGEETIAACEGVIALSADTPDVSLTAAELDAWRAASNVLERVAFAVVGASAPRAPILYSQPRSNDDPSPMLTVDAAQGGAASVAIVWRGDLRVMNAARTLGESASSLGAMTTATNASAHVRRVTSSLSARGACLSVRIDVGNDAPDRIAAIAAVGEREIRAAIANAHTDEIAWASDATSAAEQAAIIALANDHVTKTDDAPSIVIGVIGVIGATGATGTRDAIESALTDARHAWSTQVAEARTRVERGQPAAWIVVASPCGTVGEAENDAGASAVFANAVAASVRARGANADAWIANDAIGVVASAADEGSLADLVARAFAIDPFDEAPAQTRLLASSHAGLSALAEAIAPNRASSVAPSGTAYALLRLSTASIDARADALRRGPLRVAVIANDDAAHAEAAALRVDRFLARGHARACPAETAPQIPKPGTYAITTDDGASEVYVAAMVASEFENEASAIASVLDGDGGLLDGALGDGATRERSARVLGPPGARAIVVHVSAPASALDASVAQLRALLDRVRQGAIRDEDLARAKKRDDAARSIAMRDPRARVIALFRDEPAQSPVSLDRVHAAASSILHDDALVIVAARPRAAQPRKSR